MMNNAPPRKGFAYNDEGHHEGYRDATGVTFRPGLGVFVDVAFEWLDPPVRGDRPAQLLRIFQHEGLNHGNYMLQSEIIWTYNYDDLILISDFESVVPAPVVEQMKDDPKCVLLTNHGVTIDFEAITSDVSVTRAAADRPSKDRNAASILGRVDMTFTKHKVPKPKRVTAFSLWRATDKLSDLTAESLKNLVTTPIGLQPVEADDVACHLAIEVEECGGPLLPRLGETMRLGACDARIFAVSPLLFLVVTEALTRAIARDESIEGVTIKGPRLPRCALPTIDQRLDLTSRPEVSSQWGGVEEHLR